MYEYNNRRRPTHNEIDARHQPEEPKKGFFLTEFQIVVCIIALVAALAINRFGGGFFNTAKSYLKDAFDDGITSAQVTQAFHNIRDQFPDAAEVFDTDVTVPENSSSSATTASSAAAKTQSSAAAASSAAAKAQSSAAATSSAAAKTQSSATATSSAGAKA